MSRRLRRPIAALSASVLVLTLAACGDDSGTADDKPTASESGSEAGSAATGELDEVSFSGEVGEEITAEWNDSVAQPTETEVTTIVAGDGDPVTKGDTVMTYLWVANGTAKEQVFSDYDNGAPEAIPYTDELEDLFTSIFEGQSYGARVVAVTTPEVVFGEQVEGNSLGVTATDSLVIVADLIEKQVESPEPTSDKVEDVEPDTQPSVVEEGGKPTALDFSDVEDPALDAPVQRVILEEGDGAEVKASDTVVVNYLGATYDAEAPFDESFSGEPLTSPLSGLIQGWTIGLTGVKVGSRVLLQIPPAFGYGSQGSPPSIPGNATLWFVIDVVEVQ